MFNSRILNISVVMLNSRILNSSIVTLNSRIFKSSVVMSTSRILSSSIVMLNSKIIHSSLTFSLSIIKLNSRILNGSLTLLLSVIIFNISLTFFLLTFYYYTFDTIISSAHIRLLVLHTLPFHIVQYITNTFISRIVPPIISSSHNTLCASNNTHCRFLSSRETLFKLIFIKKC